MNITVRLFAMLKEQAGSDRLNIELADGATVAEAVAETGRQAGIASLLARMPLAHAINREYAGTEEHLEDGDELALIPPVSGGAGPVVEGRIHARIIEEPLSADRLTALVRDPRAGAIVVFEGVTREVDRLDYEAYAEMAETVLAEILEEVRGEHGLIAIAAEHRVGAVGLGESSVIIAASAGHRPEAFAGARAAIDRIKSKLPVWKREIEAGPQGESARWVEGTPVGEDAS